MARTHCPAVRIVLAHGILSAASGGQRRPISRLEPWYALRRVEGIFARDLLTSTTQYWLFRTHQQGSSGDFIALDRSSAPALSLRCFAIELKRSAPLRLWRRGMQLARCEQAVDWVARHHACRVETVVPVVGDPEGVLRLLRYGAVGSG